MNLTEAARSMLETGAVCDSCLGRPAASRSFGLTNEQRGRALRTVVAMVDDEDFEPVDAASCWVCEGYYGTVDAIADAIVDELADVDFDTYQVGSRIPPLVEENERLLREEAGLDPEIGESLKREINREVGRRVGAKTDRTVDFERPDVLVIVDLGAIDPYAFAEDDENAITTHAIDVQINAAFVYGRYRKLEPGIPQTEWPCRECGGAGSQLDDSGTVDCDHCGGSGYMYDTSVEQAISPHVVDAMEGSEGTFHGAGREDVDARMLGDGRPFVLEVTRPRIRSPDLEPVARVINEQDNGVEVDGLRLATYEMVERVKELPASKRYRATVTFEEPVEQETFDDALSALEGVTVEQYTPQRVDHRRASTTRERTVYAIDGDRLDPTTATVTLHGEGGLYVKELISGDDGRTDPSLAGHLGTGATVTALDVIAVEGESEPFERDAFFRDAS